MPSTQELTRRIKSIKSTRKITRAMQLVSAAKMRKSQLATLASRSYAELAWQLIDSLGNVELSNNPLVKTHPQAKKIGVVVISTNRGLVGSFNTNLLNELRKHLNEEPEQIAEVISLGKKARDGVIRLRYNLIAEFQKHDSTEHVQYLYPLIKAVTEAYKTGQYKEIIIVYNHFVSTLQQQPTVKTLLPFKDTVTDKVAHDNVIFEPSPQKVINQLLPRILESQVYQAVLESDASEHSARMLMMKNATEAAGDLIDDLTLTFNKLRQDKITTELSEITAGKIALE